MSATINPIVNQKSDPSIQFKSKKNSSVSESVEKKERSSNIGKWVLGLGLTALAAGGIYFATKGNISKNLLNTKRTTNEVWSLFANGKPTGLTGITDDGIKSLLESKSAKEFIKRHGDLISDNIMRVGSNYHRVITKRLPSGTVITNAYDVNGLALKEILGSKGSGISYFIAGKPAQVLYKVNGTTFVKSSSLSPVQKMFGGNIKLPYLEKFKGITELANCDVELYQALKNAGKIPSTWL